jgi:hypothetical protein
MSLPEGMDASVPFSLACESCDGGMEVGSYEQAISEGWTDICFTPDLAMANYLGLCPECRKREEEEEARRRAGLPPAAE